MLADRVRGAGPQPTDAPDVGPLLAAPGHGGHGPQPGPAAGSARASSAADDAGAFHLLLESLAASIAAHRRELATELLHVRATTAAEVLAAHEEAALLVQAACTDLADALSPGAMRVDVPDGAADSRPAGDEPTVATAPAPPRHAEPGTPTGTPTNPAPAGGARHTRFGDPSVLGSMPPPPARRRSKRLRRLVHLDTVLPLVAVLILLVVLVAWIG